MFSRGCQARPKTPVWSTFNMSTHKSCFARLPLFKQRIVLLAATAGLGALTVGGFGLVSKGSILLSVASGTEDLEVIITRSGRGH